MLQQEQFVYLIRLIKEEYTQPHIMAFISKDVCDEYFDRDLKYIEIWNTYWEADADISQPGYDAWGSETYA